MSRVRQFLSTPHYLDEGDGNYYNHGSPQVTGATPSSPYKSGGGGSRTSKIRQPNIITSSKTSPVRNPPVCTSPPGNYSSGPGGDQHDPLTSNPNHITFSDDLFINHTHHQVPQYHSTPVTTTTATKSMIPVRSPIHSIPSPVVIPSTPTTTNGNGKNNSNNGTRILSQNHTTTTLVTTPAPPPPPAPRKNFEAFVMTGDAILNVSKLRNDDSIR